MKNNEPAKFLDLSLDPMTIIEIMSLISTGIQGKEKWLIANHNLHSAYLLHKEPLLKLYFQRAKCTVVDGMSLVALARFYGYKVDRDQRVCYMDWWPDLMKCALHENWKVFHLGCTPEVAEKSVELLRTQFPGLNIKARHGFFNIDKSSPENKKVLGEIAEFQPNLLMVGMGMPRQELWIQNNYEEIKANIILPSGATFDYVAGAVPTPPQWAGRFGLAWVFRLAAEPRRLFTRYLFEPWFLLKLILLDVMGIRESIWKEQHNHVLPTDNVPELK